MCLQGSRRVPEDSGRERGGAPEGDAGVAAPVAEEEHPQSHQHQLHPGFHLNPQVGICNVPSISICSDQRALDTCDRLHMGRPSCVQLFLLTSRRTGLSYRMLQLRCREKCMPGCTGLPQLQSGQAAACTVLHAGGEMVQRQCGVAPAKCWGQGRF